MTKKIDKQYTQMDQLIESAKKKPEPKNGLAAWEYKNLTVQQLKNARKNHVRELWREDVGLTERVIDRIDEELQKREDQEDQ